jgi:hypothetical protein
VCFIALAGCDKSGSGSGGQSDDKKAKKKAAIGKLPPVGQPQSPVDEGRLVVSVPKDWHVASDSDKYLVRAVRTKNSQWPMVIVTVEEYKKIETVANDNLDDFVDLRREELKKLKPAPKVEPITIQKFNGVSYVRRVKTTGGRVLEKLHLETVVDNRLYRVELQANFGALEGEEKFGYAVAANLKFPKSTSLDEADADSDAASEEDAADKAEDADAKE